MRALLTIGLLLAFSLCGWGQFSTVFSDDFDSGLGWDVEDNGEGAIFLLDNVPSGGGPTGNGDFNLLMGNCPTAGQNYSSTTPLIDASAAAGLMLNFSQRRTGAFSSVTMNIEYSINGGMSWVPFATATAPSNTNWNAQSFPLPAATDGQADLRIRWAYTTTGNPGQCGTATPNYRIDDVEVVSMMLPVYLSHFTARPHSNSVQLDWRTEGERNNGYMEVEHSTDGRQYRKIGSVQGAGTTLEGQAYSFRHDTPAAGLNYYRLRQVDYDGAYAYHGPVSSRMKGGQGGKLSLFPTVASETVQVQYEGQLSSEAELQVIGMDGRVWRRQRWAVKSASLSVPVEDLPEGMYLLRLQLGREVEVVRFVKQ